MRNKLVALVVLSLLFSCGPKRLGCGPNRCSVEKISKEKIREV